MLKTNFRVKLFKVSASGGSLEGNSAAKRETWRECALAGAICNTSEKGGEDRNEVPQVRREVAWNNCRMRGDFLKLRQLIPRTTTDFHYKIGDEMEGVSQYMAFQQRLGV